MYLITIPEAHSSNTDDAVLPDVVFVDSSCRVFLGLDQSLSIYSDTPVPTLDLSQAKPGYERQSDR